MKGNTDIDDSLSFFNFDFKNAKHMLLIMLSASPASFPMQILQLLLLLLVVVVEWECEAEVDEAKAEVVRSALLTARTACRPPLDSSNSR